MRYIDLLLVTRYSNLLKLLLFKSNIHTPKYALYLS